MSRVLHAEKFTILQLEDTVPSTGSSGSAVRSGTHGVSIDPSPLVPLETLSDKQGYLRNPLILTEPCYKPQSPNLLFPMEVYNILYNKI